MKSLTENLNLSLLEIFSVLLPGGALILLCWQNPDFRQAISALLPDSKSEWQWSLVFFGAAYFLGHVLFFLGSLLDDLIYDKVKFLLYKLKEEELKSLGIEKLNFWGRLMLLNPWNSKRKAPETGKNIEKLIKGQNDLFNHALEVKKKETRLEGANIINLYKWSVAKLMVCHPEMYAEVERHQAASKFFRSMVIVAICNLIFMLCQWIDSRVDWTLCCLTLSLLIYLQQRFKAVRTAYEYIVVSAHLKVNKPQHRKKP